MGFLAPQVHPKLAKHYDQMEPRKALIDEILFFYSHWLCHANKFLYQKVHKIHHLHSAPFAITADYAHWFEEIFVNVFPQ